MIIIVNIVKAHYLQNTVRTDFAVLTSLISTMYP